MMLSVINDVVLRTNDVGFANDLGKHRIIATNGSNIIFAKQMHHVACGDASFTNYIICDILGIESR